MMRDFLILIMGLFYFIIPAQAQIDLSGFTASGSAIPVTYLTDYQCLGVNPANLGWLRNDKSINLSFLELGSSIYSDAVCKKTLINEVFSFKERHFCMEEKMTAAQNFSNHRLSMNADISTLNFSYQHPKIGGYAFAVRERIIGNFHLTPEFAELLFCGYHYNKYFDSIGVDNHGDTIGYATKPRYYGDLYKGCRISGSWYREYNFGVGLNVFNTDMIKIYAGAGVKYLQGYGQFDVYGKPEGLRVYTSLSPVFGVDYGTAQSPSRIYDSGFISVGHGFGFDLGVTVKIFNTIKVALAMNDIGSITWNGNVYEAMDTFFYCWESEGYNSYNIFMESPKLFEGDGVFKWHGLDNIKVELPTNIRFGASIQLKDWVEVGGNLYIPQNDASGNPETTIIGIGGKLSPFKWLQISTGMQMGGNYGLNIPLGFVFSLADNGMEVGFATRDLVTLFSQNTPHLSFAGGFFRFRFGQPVQK